MWLFLLIASISFGCSTNNKNGQDIQVLKFNNNGEFKIAQFTDLHFDTGSEESKPVIELISYMLDAEQPDLVVFTGDVVTGKQAKEGWRSVLEPVVERGIPFAVTLGNHDDEHDTTRGEVQEIISAYPGSLLSKVQNVSESGDYFVHLQAHEGQGVLATLYFMDSNAYSTLENVEGWGWFTFEQVEWFRQQSLNIKRNNGVIIPALAFFHIPLPEYREAFNSESAIKIGQRNEDECPPEINTGMFAAMLLAGDVMGAFVGHDHVNDYLVNHYGIGLGYGRHSGGTNSYGDLTRGARIIKLPEGKRQFRTWLHLVNGEIADDVIFPDDFQ